MLARVLVVDDDPEICRFLEAGLIERGFASQSCQSAEEGIVALGAEDFDVVVSDIQMRGMTGIELCRHVATNRPHVAVVVITAFGTLDVAVRALRAGAYDFVGKPVDLDMLELTIKRALTHRSSQEEVKRLRLEGARSPSFDELVGTSPPMRKVYDLIERVSDSDASVVITGESGTGKELVARALHRTGRRRAGPFVAVNCAAMPEALLESELFGHTKGAFTDARSARTGLFSQASGGTLLLDEIGDMPLGLQPKLLRALQGKTVRPVGSDVEVPFDARIVAATNHDIAAAVAQGRFRSDLYFRINVIRIDLPPLRSRGADVLMLAQRFALEFAAESGKRVTGLSSGAAERLLAYPWPGNVRELRNSIEASIALTRFDTITVDDLPENVRDCTGANLVDALGDAPELCPLEEIERRYVVRVLTAVGGNKSVAARILGMDRKTLYRKLEPSGRRDSDPPPSSRGGSKRPRN
jgi:two-component system response regulator HydG